jgi:very-short-patch-repair endonuclease
MPEGLLREQIFQIITEFEPVTTKEIVTILQEHNITTEKETINSLLYGVLRDVVIRDVNEVGIPTWRIRKKQFSAAGGLEAKFFSELIRQHIIPQEKSQLGFTVKNTRNNKRYTLDIAIFKNNSKYNIEIDGFDHIRADALSSIQRQIEKKGSNCEIEFEWMDNKSSFVTFGSIDTSKIYKWCGGHTDWCIRYHEELLWPKDITRNMWLIEKGWKIMRFWNVQIRDDMEKSLKEVKEWIE